MNDVRKMIFGTIIGFFVMLGVWFSIVYVSACGFTLTCHRGDQTVVRTPVPTLIPVSHAGAQAETGATEFNKCQTTAMDLIGAWMTAGSPETDVFAFTDVKGQSCEGTYGNDIQPLFVENNLWYPRALGCVSCHNTDLKAKRSAGLDMTSYASLLMGSQRADAATKGNDVLGGGNWDQSVLRDILLKGLTPDGHSADVSASNPVMYAGVVVPKVEATPTP